MALVMKRYERSLRAMIAAAGGPLDAATVRRLAHSLFKTLAQLAAAGIVCRDIKTDNILLDEYGEPVLADFGISVVLETATHIAPTSIQGTFNYMSPEALNDQAEGGIGPHTDVWALGCVIVEMLTGEMPWAGMPMQQIMMAVAVQFRVPAVPEGAPEEDLLRRCFARSPRDRPTAAQLAEAFAPSDPPPAMANMELEQILQQTMEANEMLNVRVKELEQQLEHANAVLAQKASESKPRARRDTFYHATSEENALRIQEHGFVIPDGPGGLLGRGVYCTSTLKKAMDYLKGPHGGVILQLKIDLGNCKQLVENDPMMKTWQNHGYDSAWAPFSAVNPGDTGKEENCVKNPKRITVVHAIAGSTGELRAGGYDIIDGKLRKVGGAR
jgi:serine/threonine protein kinase